MDFCEFLAEEELIEIIPNFKYPKKLNLISGDFGPFVPSIPLKVPLWLAMNLNRQHKCMIMTPKWIKQLAKTAEEQDKSSAPLEIPCEFWREIIKLLESHVEVLPNCSDLIERREAMLRTSIHLLFQHAHQENSLLISDVSVHNVTRGELQLIKFVVQKAFSHFQKLRMLTASSK
ncbi:DNA replication complex GINS protein PSF2 [Halotydeus destructor]|nr:DNA replication complex GINS protein PSF2 [Halotydeus destructor]